MTFPVYLEIGAAVWLLAAASYEWAAQRALGRLLSRKRETPAGAPTSCTILRPLSGAQPGTEERLEELCSLGVPVVVGAERDCEEIARIADRVRARHPEAALRLSLGRAPRGGNRKVANLTRMLPEATGEVVVLSDGDVAFPPDYLEHVLPPLADPAVGLVTCPYIAVGKGRGIDRLDVLLTNARFLPMVALAWSGNRERFALGATIALRRDTLRSIGGFDALRDILADDHALGARVAAKGGRIVFPPLLLEHHGAPESLRALWDRHVRWARTIFSVRPLGYLGIVFTHTLPPALVLCCFGLLPGGLALATYGLLRLGGTARRKKELSLSAKDLWRIPIADLFAFALFPAGFCGRTVRWGRHRLRLGKGSRILATRKDGARRWKRTPALRLPPLAASSSRESISL